MSVYQLENFSARVNLASRVISKKGRSTRAFEACFEMYDGDEVAVAVYRRSKKNPRLNKNIWDYLSRKSIAPVAFKMRNVKTRDLSKAAKATRERRVAEMKAYWEAEALKDRKAKS